MFPGAHHLVFKNTCFLSESTDAGLTGIDILRKAANPDAAHDSSARDPAPKCLPGTREQYVEDIVHWAVPAVGADDPLPLFWMKGPAGVGKSAVAQTCVEKLKAMGKLGAAFFFAVRIRDKAKQFFPTIIYQLCTGFPDYGDLVDQRIRRDRSIINKTMATQFQDLIVEPLQELEKSGRGIGKRIAIFIDGLDECESADAQCEIIRIIAAAARDRTTPFSWAFFSRPEAHIEGTFAIVDIANITRTSLLPVSHDADGDIELYLRSSFKSILQRRNISLKSKWPSDDDIRTLVRAANGLFIYVATAVRFIGQPGSLPEESLREILATTSNRRYINMVIDAPLSPFAELDAFYMLIMERIPPDIMPIVLLLLSQISSPTTPNTKSVASVSNAIGLTEFTFKAASNHLRAVVHVQGQDESSLLDCSDLHQVLQVGGCFLSIYQHGFLVRSNLCGSIFFYHKSFRDFLEDPGRSGSFHIKSLATRNALFRRYIEVYARCEDSYCIKDSGLALAPGVPDSGYSLSYPYTNELANSTLKTHIFRFIYGGLLSLLYRTAIDPCLLQQLQHIDFRKHLHSQVSPNIHSRAWDILMFKGYAKFISGTRLFQSYVICNSFPELDKKIGNLQRAGVIRACDPSCVSSFMSLFPTGSRDRFITGLYHMGHESKSIFWYWEIDVKLEYFREMKTVNLDEGGRIYREERFHSWLPPPL